MIDIVWKIECPALQPDEDPGLEYIPNGSVVQFHMRGPTRFAIENKRFDELGGTVWLGPTLPPDFKNSPLSREIDLAISHCKYTSSLALDANFVVTRWDSEAANSHTNLFFSERGASIGAVFLAVQLPQIGVEWELWYQRADQLLGRFIVNIGPGQIRSVPQTWRKTLIS